MQLSKARELREKRMKLVKDAQAILDQTTISAEDRSRFDTMMTDADSLKADIDRYERVDEATRTAPPADRIGGEDETEERTKKRQNAFRSFMRHGLSNMPAEERQLIIERRDMGTGGGNALQGTGGGFFVPVGFVDDVESAMKYYGPMLRVATMMPTSTGQPLPYPTDNDTGVTGEQIGEGQQVSTADVLIGSINFGAFKYSTKMVKVSIELLQDSAFNIEAFLKAKFAERLARIINTKTTIGVGGGTEPNGIITAATVGPTAVGSSTNDGGAGTGTNSIGSDDLIELEHSVDIAYRDGASYMMHDATLKFIKKIKDKYGRPLWLPGLAVKEPDTINSFPYAINNDMALIGVTGNKTVAFGQLKKYMIRQVKELSVLRLEERFADYGQVAFIGFARYDGNLLDAGTHPVKYLVQA